MAAKLLAEVETPSVWLLVDIVMADVNWEDTSLGRRVGEGMYRRVNTALGSSAVRRNGFSADF